MTGIGTVIEIGTEIEGEGADHVTVVTVIENVKGKDGKISSTFI